MNLEERLTTARKFVEQAHSHLKSGNHHGMATVAAEISMQMYGLATEIADTQFNAEVLESVYKNNVSKTFLEEKASGLTDKQSEAKAKLKWSEDYTDYLEANRNYRLAKTTHDDLGTMIDVLRTNISIKKQELNSLGG
jgi:hypothetical protein